jgi:hypothetical protein
MPKNDDLSLEGLAAAIPLTEREVQIARMRLGLAEPDARDERDALPEDRDDSVRDAVSRLLSERVAGASPAVRAYRDLDDYARTDAYKAAAGVTPSPAISEPPAVSPEPPPAQEPSGEPAIDTVALPAEEPRADSDVSPETNVNLGDF